MSENEGTQETTTTEVQTPGGAEVTETTETGGEGGDGGE